jgi:hypothetical protein
MREQDYLEHQRVYRDFLAALLKNVSKEVAALEASLGVDMKPKLNGYDQAMQALKMQVIRSL